MDNMLITYINNSLTGYLRNYLYELQGLKRGREYIDCAVCGKPVEKINNKKKYCKQCASEVEKSNWNKRKRKQRELERGVTK